MTTALELPLEIKESMGIVSNKMPLQTGDDLQERMEEMLHDGKCVTYQEIKFSGFCNSGCPPGVYLMWVNGAVKVGRSSDVYNRYFWYLDHNIPTSYAAKHVFLLGFMSALPGEDLKALEKSYIKACKDHGAEVSNGREWFCSQYAVLCLEAMGHLASERHEGMNQVATPLLPQTTNPTIEQQALHFFPMYVATRFRAIVYLVLAMTSKGIVFERTVVPFRSTWTVLACYVEDATAMVCPTHMETELKKEESICGKISAFFKANVEETCIFMHTDPDLFLRRNECCYELY